MPDDLVLAQRLAVAGLAGLAVGVEREWSHGHLGESKFAGVRTFLLFGLVGGVAGLLIEAGLGLVATAILVGGAGLVVASYVMALGRNREPLDPGVTTEAAALVVLGLGVLAGLGHHGLAAGAAALVALALGEKARLHWLVRHIGERELIAGLQFLVLALVVLPLLPVGPFGPGGAIRPRSLWGIVLVLSGLDFAGYVARRVVGPQRGYGVTGLFGGVVSSTAVTLAFSRKSRTEPHAANALALGVIGACTVLLPRVAIVGAALAPAMGEALVPFLFPPLVVGVLLAVAAFRRQGGAAGQQVNGETGNPLRLLPAIQMAIGFQLAMLAIPMVQRWLGSAGVLASAAVLGLTDMDALTVSMSRLALRPEAVALGARAIAIGIIANTTLKLAIVLALGEARFRKAAGAGLVALGIASGIGLWLGVRWVPLAGS